MPKTNYSTSGNLTIKALLLLLLLPCVTLAATPLPTGEVLSGYYAREGNNGSPSKTSGNNIYIKFYDDRWIGMMFIPYPYASDVTSPQVSGVFRNAKQQVSSAAIVRGKFKLLDEPATLQIERYGYLENRIIFECGGLSPCTIKPGAGFIELIKPGVINEHIIRYRHVPGD